MKKSREETTKELVTGANTALEANDFLIARDMYRAAARNDIPTRLVLANMDVAEQQERLQFRRSLVSIHGDDLLCNLSELRLRLDVLGPAHVIDKVTTLIELGIWQPGDEFALRKLRVRAAVAGAITRHFVDDVVRSWELSEQIATGKRVQRAILRQVAAIEDPVFETPIAQLQDSAMLPDFTTKFLKAKRDELAALNMALSK